MRRRGSARRWPRWRWRCAGLPAAPAPAAPQTSIADVEDEVMCPICGTLLELAESPQAQRERAFIAG